MHSYAIQLQDVSKSFPLYSKKRHAFLHQNLPSWFPFHVTPQAEHHALKNIDLSIIKGERIGIVGRNGAGKTTLLKLISGSLSPTSGKLKVSGSVQALMQSGLGFHSDYTGRLNISAALQYNGLTPSEEADALEDIIDFCELGAFIDQPYKTYSLGMQGRLQFAVSTAIKPEILVIDEVLGSGDMYFAAKSARRLEEMTSNGCTLIVVSHDLSQIIRFCNRALWINEGSIVADSDPQEIINKYEVFSHRLMQQSSLSSAKQGLSNNSSLSSLVDMKAVGEQLSSPSNETFQSVLPSGQVVYRWDTPSDISFAGLTVNDKHDLDIVLNRHESLTIDYDLNVLKIPLHGIRIHASIFGLDGDRKAWVTSPCIPSNELTRDKTIHVQCHIPIVHLSAGSYLISTSIFSGHEPAFISQATRYDLISRCIKLHITDNDRRSPSTYHEDSEWQWKSL